MRLIRGWEKPTATGGLRLNKAVVYREIDEEDGLGDPREGEVRIRTEGLVTVHPDEDDPWQRLFGHIPVDPKWKQDLRDLLAETLDDPNLEMKEETEERLKVLRNTRIDDSEIGSPYLFCLSREPLTNATWQNLRAALPDRYEYWTVTESIDTLKFEIECGIKRWLALNDIARQEYRIAWDISTPQPTEMPDSIDIELTKTGLSLFRPWTPPR